MRKPAKHQINTCPTCQGKGKVQGPKMVYLTLEDHEEHERLGRVYHKAWGWLGFLMFLVTPFSGLAIVLTVPKEDGITALVVVLTIIFLAGLGIADVADRAIKSRYKILAEYDAHQGENLIVQKDE